MAARGFKFGLVKAKSINNIDILKNSAKKHNVEIPKKTLDDLDEALDYWDPLAEGVGEIMTK